MTVLKRLKWLSAALAVAGVITSATVWGDPSRGRPASTAARATKLFSDNVVGKYTNQPAIAYHGQDGSVYFALQVKPELTAAPQKPRDIAILVDASASQAGPSLEAARKLAREVIGSAAESDRISLWTVSTPKTTRNLVRGGGMKPASEARAALIPLEAEYASGAVDLKDTIDRVAKEFDGKTTRQQVILYLGDGESALNPIGEKVRYQLADNLRAQNISFYAVPLGSGVNAHNIHTLVSGTGGALIRPGEEKTSDVQAAFKSMATRFHKAMGVPVLEAATAKFGFAAAEVYPAKLPPLRADVPTLVVGRLEKGSDVPVRLDVSLSGQVAGAPATAQVSHPLPAPTPDNFFLTSMVTQWAASGRSEAPAMLQADRTLALAYETTRLAREEFIEQADWALGSKKIGAAKALYDAANNLDPSDPRIKAGIKLVDKIDKGEISLDDLKKATQETKVDLLVKENLLAQAPKEAPKEAPPVAAPVPNVDPNQLLQQEAARQKIREQQTTGAVDETLSRARALLNSGDPKSSKDLLVAQRDSIRVLGDIGEVTRQRLLNRIDLLLSEVGVRGDAMIRARAEENERIARAHQRQILADQAVAREDKIRERIRNFAILMNQARYEDAYREALVMENEFVNEGRRVPLETQAVAKMGQSAANYRDFRELVRLREDRYLLAMMEVEKAHMPYPDEPAVHFPPAKVWREMTALRRRYASTDFDRDLTPRQKQRFQFLGDSLLHQLNLGALNVAGADYKFGDLLKALQQRMSDDLKRDVTLYIKRETFTKDQADRLRDMPVNLGSLMDATDTVLKEVSFKTILDTITRQVGASFWVTPDAIEIVSIESAKTSRVFKVMPVEDLIVPIPNSVNRLALQQQLQVLGQQFSLAGGNAFGALGAFGGGFGGFQFGGGGVQIQGGGAGGGLNGMVGQLFQGGAAGQGGGGVLGFGGQQVGQFGNLGGQFGFQGGRQSADPATELVVLIQSVVDPGFWDPDVSFLSKRILTGQNDQDAPIEAAPVEANERNKMMFNLTTRSLVLFARSRFHRSSPGKPLKRDEMMAAPGANPDGRQLAGNDPKPRPAPVPLAVKPVQKPVKVPGDPEKMWKTAIAKGVKDPGMIIACADFLAQAREFKHAAELLKASLRQGLTPERWYQEALAIALEESQASPEEIERAHLSAIDLEPKNAQTYLTVSTALNQMGDADSAIRLCKIAAKLEPNVPDAYVNALAFANNPKASASYDTSDFAAGGLLSRDWASDSINFHAQARTHLLEAVKKLDLQNKKAEAERVRALIEADKKRDLVVELLWAGSSDLDLRISEPTGTRCSSIQPMTTGGGSLQADQVSQKDDSRSEIYTASQAFDGTYKIAVDRIWGRPQGNKAAIKVIHHQGMPNEKVELFTLDLTKETELTIRFEGGRRKDLAALPSPVDLSKYNARPNESAQVMNKLRALVTGIGNVGLSGGVGASNAPSAYASAATTEKRLGDVTWATRLGSERSVGVDIQSTTTIRPDGQVEVKAAPVFDALPKDTRVKLDLIPGAE